MSENQEQKKMSMVCEASGLVRRIAYPATGKAALLRAYRKLGTWTYNRVKDVYYADSGVRISGEEIDKLRVTAREEVTSSDPSIAELRTALAAVVRQLQRIDPTFCDPLVKTLRSAAHSDSREADTGGGNDGSGGAD